MKTRRPTVRPSRSKRMRYSLICAALLLILAVGTIWFISRNNTEPIPRQTATLLQNKATKQPKEEPTAPLPPLIDLQPTLDTWIASQRADYGVEVYDVANQKVVAAHQANKAYYTASIYKLYVVYLTYQQMQAGQVVDMPGFLGSQSRLECLNQAIYSSDSPCAEKLMKELTQKVMQDKVNEYGATNTGFPSFQTSAHDVNLVLNRIALKKDLNDEYTSKLLTSMSTQIYNKGLAKGFVGASVASKVGFNENLNYHDAGIVTLASGRQYLVSVFSQGQGSPAPQASLAAALNATLTAAANSAQ